MIDGSAIFFLSILLVCLGQLGNALIVLVDKHIVTNTSVTRPGVYAFFVSIISGAVVVLLPFGVVHMPSPMTIFLSLDLGFIFIGSIILLYRALKHANATDVIAWLTAISTLSTFIFAALFLDETLPKTFPLALFFILVGMLLVGHFRFYARSFKQVVGSGVLFGLSVVMLKLLFSQISFVDAFFWSRMGNVVAALSLLLFPSIRKHLFTISRNTSHQTGLLIVGNRILGGVAFLSVLYALKLGSASIVNALSSLQFVFIFVLIFVFRRFVPELYRHEFRKGHVLHKVAAMCFIIMGFFILFA